MTSFEIVVRDSFEEFLGLPQSRLRVGPIDVANPPRGTVDPKLENWPVVYTLNNSQEIYIGETRSAFSRLRQHHQNSEKNRLDKLHVVIDKTFNKSAALDLESFLIRFFSGEGNFTVLNRNDGIVDTDYFNRQQYQETFDEIFEALRVRGLFSRSIEEIQNLDLYKFSPFKAPSAEQAVIGSGTVERFLDDMRVKTRGEEVIQGGAGTGKTVLAIYLLKLLRDIERRNLDEEIDTDTMFSEFFRQENQELLSGFTAGLVIPQQSLRESVSKVFRNTPDLGDTRILTPFQVGESEEVFDLLIVDEAHRLNQRANQSSGSLNKKFQSINESLFGKDSNEITQLDWVRARSRHRVLLIDYNQTVRPADISRSTVNDLIENAQARDRFFVLETQMRVKAGTDYPGFIRRLLDGVITDGTPDLGDTYEFGVFTSLEAMRATIKSRNEEYELSRVVAGFAWPWRSKKDKSLFDIEEDGLRLRWNSTDKDWINSKNSLEEVGSIHTVQGYDLNYAGVIIGRDLRMDPTTGEVIFDRQNYFDKKGMENNSRRGIRYNNEDILAYVKNIYSVLLSRGIRGTFIYVCDEPLREYFLRHLPQLDGEQ